MPTTHDPNSTGHREQHAAQLYSHVFEFVQKKFPKLTEGQTKAITQKIASDSLYLGATSMPSDLMLDCDCNNIAHFTPNLLRAVPTAAAVKAALLAQRPHSPVEQLTMSRRINTMTPDELLAASEGLDLSKSAPKATEAQLTPWEAARQTGWSKEDQILKDRGHDPEAMLADKRIELRYAVAVETAPKPTPGIDEIKFRMSTLGVKFADLDPKLQIKAQHEAGKNVSLATFGIDVTK